MILSKKINEIRLERAVDSKEQLPKKDIAITETRYVKDEKRYFMFVGNTWIEINLI